MTVFKAFLKILNKNKFIVILYTVILISFGGINMQTSDNNTNFVASKPDILIINHDNNNLITNNLIKYIKDNSNIKKIKNNKEAINDGLFYRDVNYIIYIPKNYGNDFLQGNNPQIKIKSTGDYQSSFAEMLLSRYIKVANIYQKQNMNKEDIVTNINKTLSIKSDINIVSKIETNKLFNATYYYNFASYSILACLVYVICLIVSSFRQEKIKKRIVVSSMNYKTFNKQLLISNCLFALILWMFYVLVSFIMVGNIMFSIRGLIYILNSFIFTLSATTIAFFIGNIVSNKNIISGIVNIISLGSSFLCGAFVPVEFLPSGVLNFAHLLPSYYYINTNELLKNIEIVNINTLKPIIINSIVLIIFSIIFIILTNIISKKNRKEN